MSVKLRCDERFTHVFTACGCVFKEIMLVGSNRGNYFENVAACSKRTLKTRVATQPKNSRSNSYMPCVPCVRPLGTPNLWPLLTGSRCSHL